MVYSVAIALLSTSSMLGTVTDWLQVIERNDLATLLIAQFNCLQNGENIAWIKIDELKVEVSSYSIFILLAKSNLLSFPGFKLVLYATYPWLS